MATTQTSGGFQGFLVNTVDGRRYFNSKTFDARAFNYSFINKLNPQRLQLTGANIVAVPANTLLTAQMMKNGIVTQAAATNLNLTPPTAAQLYAAWNLTQDNQPFDVFSAYTFSIQCNGVGSVTIQTNTGVTIVGKASVEANKSGRFRIVNATISNNAFVIYRIG